MYGITGATGRSTSTTDWQLYIATVAFGVTSQLKLDPSSIQVTPRYLHTLAVNHQPFVAAGGDVTKFREFEICIQ